MNDELKEMNQSDLAKRIIGYIDQLNVLMNLISFFDGNPADRETILNEYKDLKTVIKSDAHYVGLTQNKKKSDSFYFAISKGLCNAAAYGFTASVNSRICKLHSSVEIAHYRLRQCFPYNDLQKIAST